MASPHIDLVLLVLHVLLLLMLPPNAHLMSPAMIAQEGIRRLAKLFRKKLPSSKPQFLELPPSRSHLFEVPLDIILIIVIYLNDCDVLSLALTLRVFTVSRDDAVCHSSQHRKRSCCYHWRKTSRLSITVIDVPSCIVGRVKGADPSFHDMTSVYHAREIQIRTSFFLPLARSLTVMRAWS